MPGGKMNLSLAVIPANDVPSVRDVAVIKHNSVTSNSLTESHTSLIFTAFLAVNIGNKR